MRFTDESFPIGSLRIGEACISELDHDDGDIGYRYVIQEKNSKTVTVVRFDPSQASRTRMEVPATMRVCRAI